MSNTSSPLVQRVSERDVNRGAQKSAQQAVTLRTTVWLSVDGLFGSHQDCSAVNRPNFSSQHLSENLAGATGLEPAASCVTGRHLSSSVNVCWSARTNFPLPLHKDFTRSR